MTGCLVALTDLAKRITPGSRFALVLRYVATGCALGLVMVDSFACRLISLVNRVKRGFFCHFLRLLQWLLANVLEQLMGMNICLITASLLGYARFYGQARSFMGTAI
jgi:hypothetical protein